MERFNLVNSQDLNTKEQYAVAIQMAVMSLKTLKAYEIQAYKKGLLDDEEQENGKTIVWELDRLMQMYKSQMDLVVARLPDCEQDKIFESLKEQIAQQSGT